MLVMAETSHVFMAGEHAPTGEADNALSADGTPQSTRLQIAARAAVANTSTHIHDDLPHWCNAAR